jgi:hypothetical protein
MHLIVVSISLFPPYNLTIPYALHAVYLTQTQRSPVQQRLGLYCLPPLIRPSPRPELVEGLHSGLLRKQTV